MTTRRQFLLGAAAAAITAACGGDDDDAAPTTTTTSTTLATTTTEPPPPPPTAPLTGLPIDPALLARPALIVKVSNSDGARAAFQARPQAGLNQADVVIEEMAEGSTSRFAAIFHSTDAAVVGPVRSFRTSDLDIVAEYGMPLFAYSGANTAFLEALRSSGRVVDIGIDRASGAYRRAGDRTPPQNLMSGTPELFAAGAGQGTPPPAHFAFRDDPGAPPGAGARPVSRVAVNFGSGAGSAPTDYTWDPAAGGFARNQKGTPHVDADGVQVAPPNLLLQVIDYVDSGARDTSGAVVPEAVVLGEGPAFICSGGMVIEGRWRKPEAGAVTEFLDAAGAPAQLTRGRTWIILPPPGAVTLA